MSDISGIYGLSDEDRLDWLQREVERQKEVIRRQSATADELGTRLGEAISERDALRDEVNRLRDYQYEAIAWSVTAQNLKMASCAPEV